MKISYSKVIFAVFLGLTANCHSAEILKETDWKGPGYVPKNGFVPDKNTAVGIAVAILSPIYGKETISGEQPLVATLENGVWTVRGSLPKRHVGGVAEIQISKTTGQILKVSHSR